jgi:hypothetical protein
MGESDGCVYVFACVYPGCEPLEGLGGRMSFHHFMISMLGLLVIVFRVVVVRCITTRPYIAGARMTQRPRFFDHYEFIN